VSDEMGIIDDKTYLKLQTTIRTCFRNNSTQYKIILSNALSKKVGPLGGRRWDCHQCGKAFPSNEIQVDHIDPIIPLHMHYSKVSFELFYVRCWCSTDNLQVLCLQCHKAKSKLESAERKKYRALHKSKV
jgi:hypothetical protein